MIILEYNFNILINKSYITYLKYGENYYKVELLNKQINQGRDILAPKILGGGNQP